MRRMLALSLVGICLMSLIGCGSSNSGSVSLKFVNTAITTRTGTAPTVFKMKLIAAYLAADIDPNTGNNIGGTAIFYMNPDCADDIMHCDISAGTAEDGSPYSHIVTSFFDFAQSSAAVNAALNAQGRSVDAGTYKYARLEFCKTNSANQPNIQWGTASHPSNSFQRNSCTVNSAQFTTPLVIAAGGSATVTLSYDYTTAITASGGDNCNSSGTQECFTLPTFTPSATN